MFRVPACCSFVLISVISACGVTPARVSYEQVAAEGTKAGSTDGYLFRLRRSMILTAPNDKGVLGASASPWEFTVDGKAYTPLYKISGRDDFRSTTQIKISYIDNTKEPDQVSFTTVDNVSATIEKIGALGSAIAPIAAGLVSGTESGQPQSGFRPTRIDPGDPASYSWQQDVLNPDYCMRLTEVIEEPGVIAKDYFNERATTTARDFPAPACASAQVEVTRCSSTDSISASSADLTIMRTTYASSRLVSPTPIPSSGTVKFNSICGVSVTSSDKEDRTDLLTYLTKAAKSATDIQAAWKKAKDDKKNAAH
ncbi:hypothetical protein P0D69_40075 [Paraburkholderia sediminicola]|uniref:hypothetical protein n=1 Tax=Paraburkholderia sediminicola TaxID=458836 RepID=UPI0038BCA6DB